MFNNTHKYLITIIQVDPAETVLIFPDCSQTHTCFLIPARFKKFLIEPWQICAFTPIDKRSLSLMATQLRSFLSLKCEWGLIAPPCPWSCSSRNGLVPFWGFITVMKHTWAIEHFNHQIEATSHFFSFSSNSLFFSYAAIVNEDVNLTFNDLSKISWRWACKKHMPRCHWSQNILFGNFPVLPFVVKWQPKKLIFCFCLVRFWFIFLFLFVSLLCLWCSSL